MNILINGGSRGIGAQMVRDFSQAGHRVVFTYCSSEREARALENETGAFALRADSASESDVTRAVELAAESLGKIDVLINNAAVSHIGLFTDMSEDEWNSVMNVNVGGVFRFSRAVLPQMIREKWGRIINISSMWGICGASCEVAYSTSKAAIIGMTKALAKELGPCNITVNCIAPGLIDTDMNNNLSTEEISAIIEETPLGRIGEPKDISAIALFLAGESAGFITGEVINASGGLIT